MSFFSKHYPAVVMVFMALFFWEGYVRIAHPPNWILPAPTSILKTLVQERYIILEHTWVTLNEALIGFTLAIVISLILAVLIDSSSFLKRGIYPILVTSQTIPIIAIAPLLFIWFGFGILPKVVVVVLVAFFPIVISLVDGFNQTDQGLISLLKTMNATKTQIFLKVRFPSALSSMFSGLRIAGTYSVMGAVIGEWLGASKGLGMYMKNTSHSFLTDKVFAAIIVVVTLSIAIYSLLLILEQLAIPWQRKKKVNTLAYYKAFPWL